MKHTLRQSFTSLRFALAGALVVGISGCASVDAGKGQATSRAEPAVFNPGRLPVLPPMKTFGEAHLALNPISNADLARDFLDLTFRQESGKTLPYFTRYEAPVRVSINGTLPGSGEHDLNELLARLRDQAGIDIARAPGGETGNLVVQPVSHSEIHSEIPTAACFVIPNVTDISQYRGARRKGLTDWAKMTTRTQTTIVVPADAAPQELRDCLNEELSQAIGPINDLYRLPDSIYNDDNMQTIMTGFDILMERITYAPELHSGMTKQQVADRLPAILQRLNPRGMSVRPRNLPDTGRAWKTAIDTAVAGNTSTDARIRAAHTALTIAKEDNWDDHRTAFSYYVLGRLSEARNPDLGLKCLQKAYDIYNRDPRTAIHAANVAIYLARHDILRDKPDAAFAILKGRGAVALRHQDADLYAQILMLRAEVYGMQGKFTLARETRKKSLGWARYGMGTPGEIYGTLAEIAALDPDRLLASFPKGE